MSKNKKVAPELDEAKIKEYYDHYRDLTLSTVPTDKTAAEKSLVQLYAYLHGKGETVSLNPEIIWVTNPWNGCKEAARHKKGSADITLAEAHEQAELASYGSFEACWVSSYAFAAEQYDVQHDGLINIVKDIVKECGVYWTFEDLIIVSPKPSKILVADEQIHCADGPAIQYPDGHSYYCYKGERKKSLMEVKIAAKADTK